MREPLRDILSAVSLSRNAERGMASDIWSYFTQAVVSVAAKDRAEVCPHVAPDGVWDVKEAITTKMSRLSDGGRGVGCR